ncbi:hypothetical protein A4H97_14155 [Niastella yeongjuensis]|uniref:Uncharacterized protein n=1 Tax=Niastella yeongjuensis TaxID=354355 RepID=A0A1V9E3S3_9BACT|nr:hypothetical protein [Niastella yeongjuensis]OQP40758.1 hypothetical protein A4H97_14155 [Niastella yeongjuensis]SEP02615.1 hypothetical protein SAMN05660816_04225 [Niastella yeongjuensis]
MISCKLELTNGEILEIAFKEGQTCSLTVNGGSKYTFLQQDGKLKVGWEIEVLSRPETVLRPDIVSITVIPFMAENFKGNNKEKGKQEFARHNCCTLNGHEYCIFDGCVNAPCGQICA